MPIRSPIIVVVGHVDHGKSTLLDKIRRTAVQKNEAGGITQSIGATEIPATKIKEISGDLLNKMNIKLNIPGLLAIDTPGHEAFTNLRRRGGSIADLAILVIDINSGVQPQTKESIEILKQFKVPFVIAANKIDLIPGWVKNDSLSYLDSFSKQPQQVKDYIQKRVYGLMGELGKYNINCDLFNNIKDFTQNVAIIPCSGLTGEGISELLMIISGLAEKYLTKNLEISPSTAKGSVLEVKEIIGLGTIIDVIIYDGILKKNQYLIVGAKDKPIITKIKALLKPCELQEIRDKKCNFENVDNVIAACGIRISAPNLDKAIAGMPVESAQTLEQAKIKAKEMENNMDKILIHDKPEGVVLKADSLGSLEALQGFLERNNIKIASSSIGDINKKDVIKSINLKKKNVYNGIIMGFNIKINNNVTPLINENNIKVINSNIIYHLLDNYSEWKNKIMVELKRQKLNQITMPCKIQIMGDFLFRKSNPLIVGVNILNGTLKKGTQLMKENGEIIGTVKQLQNNGITIPIAKTMDKVACSIEGATYDKDVIDHEILYSFIPEKDFIKIKRELKLYMNKKEIMLVKEIVSILRKKQPLWGLG